MTTGESWRASWPSSARTCPTSSSPAIATPGWSASVRGVPIVSSDQHGVGLARIRYCRGADERAPRLADIERRVAVATTPPRSELGAQVAAAVAPWEAKVKPVAEAPVATLAKECAPRALNGAAMGDQVARATAERLADAAAPPAGVPIVGLVNTGALRGPLPAGVVRYGDLFTVFPFENTVAACGTTRRGLVRFIENAIREGVLARAVPLRHLGRPDHAEARRRRAALAGRRSPSRARRRARPTTRRCGSRSRTSSSSAATASSRG